MLTHELQLIPVGTVRKQSMNEKYFSKADYKLESITSIHQPEERNTRTRSVRTAGLRVENVWLLAF